MTKQKDPTKQYCYKRLQQFIKNVAEHRLDGTPFPEYRSIEDCKSEIESWYEWDSFNPFLIRGYDEKEARLESLKKIKPNREPFYKHSDENQQILNLICEYPDVMDAGRIGGGRKLTLDRDRLDKKWKTIVKEFLESKKRIERQIKKENERLRKIDIFFESKQPFEVSIKSDVEQTHIIPAKKSSYIEREIKRFLKELSVSLFPS